MKKSRIVKLITIPIFIGVIFFGIILAAANYFNGAPKDTPEGDIVFPVHKGATIQYVADKLEEDRLIRSSLFFKLIVRARNTDKHLRAGAYSLPGGSHTIAIHDLLMYGDHVEGIVIIPEGMTMSQIAVILEEKSIVSADEFLNAVSDPELLARYGIPADSFEGYLYPDTYNISCSSPAEDVIDVFVSNFYERIGQIVDLDDYTPEEVYQKVIMASIIEREYRVPSEAPKMASVFYNRLNENKRLESCATVMYVITEELGKPYPKKLHYSDLYIASPYNTYRNRGLPPRPISNPGKVALLAAFEPAQTDYFYFVVNNPVAGTHNFSTTLDEHKINKFQYKQLTEN